MPRFAPSAPVRVRVSDCCCPDTPHADGDFVTLHPKLTVEAGLAASASMGNLRRGDSPVTAVMTAILPHVIAEWDFLDAETGLPIPVSPEAVTEALPWDAGGKEVADRAVDLYIGALSGTPLPSRASTKATAKSSPSTPTRLTSRSRRSSSKPPAPSE